MATNGSDAANPPTTEDVRPATENNDIDMLAENLQNAGLTEEELEQARAPTAPAMAIHADVETLVGEDNKEIHVAKNLRMGEYRGDLVQDIPVDVHFSEFDQVLQENK